MIFERATNLIERLGEGAKLIKVHEKFVLFSGNGLPDVLFRAPHHKKNAWYVEEIQESEVSWRLIRVDTRDYVIVAPHYKPEEGEDDFAVYKIER